LGQQTVQRRVGGELLIVVEDQRTVSRQPSEEPLAVCPGETRQSLLILRRQPGKRGPAVRSDYIGRARQVVEERCGLCVRRVELVPKARDTTVLHVARGKRRLARARRTEQPGGLCAFPSLDETIQQAL